jgi:hypothetical protein
VAGQESGEDDQKGQRSGDGEMMQERRERDQLEWKCEREDGGERRRWERKEEEEIRRWREYPEEKTREQEMG